MRELKAYSSLSSTSSLVRRRVESDDRGGRTRSAVGESPPEPDTGPYATFNQALHGTVHGAYSGPLGLFAVGPDAVAKVIEHAITTDRPKARYPVTLGARAILLTRRVLSDRAFDAVLRRQFVSPEA